MDWDPSKSYIKSYKSLCDYYDVQPNDDFIRIVSYVCFSKNKKTLDLTDFKTENPYNILNFN